MSHTITRIVWGWDLTCCNPSRLSSSHFWYACSIYVLLGCQWVVYAKYSRNPVLPAQSTAAPCCYWATSQGNQVSWIFLCHSCWCFWVLASSTGCIWRVNSTQLPVHVLERVWCLCNYRFNQIINSAPSDIWVTAFFLIPGVYESFLILYE